jgi:GAF domain-containing protein
MAEGEVSVMPRGIEWAIDLLHWAGSVEEVESALRSSARAAANADGATVIRREGPFCHYVAEDAMSPLWCGQRFPLSECISGWAMTHNETVRICDITADSRVPQSAYRPTFVRSLAVAPIGRDPAFGAIGAYWAELHEPSPAEIAAMELLASAAADALIRIRGGAPVMVAA